MNKLKFLASFFLMQMCMDAVAENLVVNDGAVVYRSSTCSCCGKWTEHVKENQINIKTVVSDDMQAIKAKYGIPEKLASCHTAIINGYIIEGHVPAEDIKKLLKEKPDIVGVAAPGMPMGSPGMEMNGQKQDYQIISFDKQGKTAVFAKHAGDE